MAYQEKPQQPESHFVVVIQVKEVTPPRVMSGGVVGGQKETERRVEDVVTLSVSKPTLGQALSSAQALLNTVSEGEGA
jgi:hypothetical protein